MKKSIPTKEGLFYRRHSDDIEVVKVWKGEDLYYTVNGEMTGIHWVEDDGEWYGEVPKPGEFIPMDLAESLVGEMRWDGDEKRQRDLVTEVESWKT